MARASQEESSYREHPSVAPAQRSRDYPSQSWARDRESLTKYVFGLITTIGLAAGGWLWAGHNSHEARLVVLETQRAASDAAKAEETRRLDARLERIEKKLDEGLLFQRGLLHGSEDRTR